MLTLLRHYRRMSKVLPASTLTMTCAVALGLTLGGCAQEPAPAPKPEVAAQDPLLARALNDPLMVDPDLAYRNEANAAVTVSRDHILPPFAASEELANRAREEALAELLEEGPLTEFPVAADGTAPADLTGIAHADDMLLSAGGSARCAKTLRESLDWAALMPEPAAIMPHGMVQQAAGAERGNCSVRVVRYLTPARIEDAVQYHLTKMTRGDLDVSYYSGKQPALIGQSATRQVAVFARRGPGGMSAIDLITWRM